MCLIVFAYNVDRKYKLILAANRDEFLNRATAKLHKWKNPPGIIGGRDLHAGGTWMAVDRNMHFAALTNVRNPAAMKSNARSRGDLIPSYLLSGTTPLQYLEELQKRSKQYNGFNLLAGDADTLFFFSSMNQQIIPVQPGIHGISNHTLNTPWVKVEKVKTAMKNLLKSKEVMPHGDRENPFFSEKTSFVQERDIKGMNETKLKAALYQMMQDRELAADADLPDTGVGYDLEKKLSSVFIAMPGYGTRSTSVVFMGRSGSVNFSETTWSGDADSKVTITDRA